MHKTHEILFAVPEGATIIRAKVMEDGKAVKVYYNMPGTTKEVVEDEAVAKLSLDEMFPVVRVSELSVEDEWFKHKPTSRKQRLLKNSLRAVIESGIPDFRRAVMDPSEEDGKIVFKEGNYPAIEYSAKWWEDNAKNVMPEKNSRLAVQMQYDAFLGELIKTLVDKEGFSIHEAWYAVCDDSKDIGHYLNSPTARQHIECTGSRKIGKWYDLANTCKIIRKDNGNGFMMASGYYCILGNDYTLADLVTVKKADVPIGLCVGWIVMDV